MQLSRRRFMKQTALGVTALGLGAINCSQSQPPNIILLYSDELDPKYLSCYGGEIPTPNLDTLAAGGVRFTHAYTAAPMCTPSRFSVLTGKYAGRCNSPEFLETFPENVPYSVAWNTWLTPSMPTIPRLLSKHGYLTGVTGKWHISKLDADVKLPKFNPDDDPKDETVNQKLQERQKLVSAQVRKDAGFDISASVSWGNLDGFPVKALQYHNFPWMTKGAVDIITQGANSGKPFFLYCATTAVHGPAHYEEFDRDSRYTPEGFLPEVARSRPPVEDYKAKLSSLPPYMHHKWAGMMELDYHVGQILKAVKDLGIEDNTMIIFIADHNTEPGKATCYEKGNHVPWLVRWPAKIASGQVNDQLVQTVDVLPTVMKIAGVQVPADIVLDGNDFMPAIKANKTVRDYIYLESGYTRSVSDGKYKYIAFRPPEQELLKMREGKTKYAPNHLNTFKQAHSHIAIEHYPAYFDADQLYDLNKDPFEQKNVIDDPAYKETLERLRTELEKRLATFKHPFDLQTPPFMQSEQYQKLTDNTRAIGTDFIEWLARDHGKIVWPPE